MKERTKIFFAWMMLVVLLYNFEFSFFVFELSVEVNRSLMEKNLERADNKQLQLLKITDENSIIRKGSHEIVYEGRMYDVKKEIRKYGVVYFYCIHDAAEDNFYAALETIVKINSDSSKQRHKSNMFGIQNHFAKKYFLFEKSVTGFQPEFLNEFVFDDVHCLPDKFSSIITPPPRV